MTERFLFKKGEAVPFWLQESNYELTFGCDVEAERITTEEVHQWSAMVWPILPIRGSDAILVIGRMKQKAIVSSRGDMIYSPQVLCNGAPLLTTFHSFPREGWYGWGAGASWVIGRENE